MTYIAHGVVAPNPKLPFGSRLNALYTELSDVIEKFSPTDAAVEETFVNNNPLSTLKLGMARGVVFLVPARHGLVVGEYSANRVKKTVVGVGHACKEQVLVMIKHLLPKSNCNQADAADALAVAICHGHFLQGQKRWGNME